MRKVYSDIDEAAEVDVCLFWKITKRRKPRTTRISPEIRNEEGITHTDPNGVTEAFASFYKRLYLPLEDTYFDTDFKKEIEDSFKLLTDECEADHGYLPGDKIILTEITTTITSLKRRKAPGDDSITNEHLIHGGKQLKTGLLKLFNAIVNCCYGYDYWKRGLIVPLYKGRNKPKDSCKS